MSKPTLYTGIAIVIAIIVVAYFFFLQGAPNIMQNNQPQNSQNQQPAQNINGVVVQDLKVGTGAEAVSGTKVTVSYVGKLQNGTVFDQSSAHGGSFTFDLGAGQVIQGWEQGIQGMKVGGERVLIIPPTLAYGAQQVGPIPPNSTLVFDVQLLNVASSTAQ